MSNSPDLQSLSRAELEALLQKQNALLAEKDELIKKKEAEAAREKLQFHKKLSKVKEKLAAAGTDNRKLKICNSNLTTIYENLIVYIKENRLNSMKLFEDEMLPSVYEYQRLNEFLTSMAFTLIDSVRQLHYHQEHSLNLGTSEQNHGEIPLQDDDKFLEKYGREEASREAEVRESDEQHQFEFDDDSKTPADSQKDNNVSAAAGVKIYAPGRYPDARQDNESLYSHLSNSDSRNIEERLKTAVDALKDLPEDGYHNQGVVRRRPERHYVSANRFNEVAGILTYGGKKSVWMYCHNCRKVTEFVLNSKADRVNTLYTLSGGCQDVKNTLVPVYTASCPECGESTQLNPAVVQDLSVIEDTDSLKGEGRLFLNEETANRDSPHVDEDMTVSDTGINGMRTARMASECRSAEVPNTPVNSTETACKHTADSKETSAYRQEDAARQKERRRLYREIRNNQGNLTMSCGNYRFVEGTSIIDPWSFNAGAYGMTPAFVKSRLSIGLLSVMGATFCQMGVAKNKIKTVFDGAGLPISREQLTGGINCFARAFLHKTAEQIKKDILSSSETILMDETTLVVTETARKKKAQGSSRKSEMWVLNSGWTSSISASYYYISPARAGKTAVEILKDMPKSVKKYLVADGYTGYDTAARTLNKEYGTSIVLARCHTHSRRPLHNFLKDHGLLKIYNQYLLPKNSRFTDFYDNIKKYREKKRGRLLTERDAELLSIYYLINALFVVDSAVAVRHGYDTASEEFSQELMKERNNRSAIILDALFDAVRIFIARNPLVMKASVNEQGQICYTPNRIFPESTALLYLIRYEKDLRRFIESPSVELSQSGCERAIKEVISVRRNAQKLQSIDGANALADFMSIAHTCALNHVSVQQYILWLTANIKHQLYQMKLAGHDDPTFFTMPKKAELFENGEKKTIGIYDPKNIMCYDKVDVTGLTPYAYKKYLAMAIK